MILKEINLGKEGQYQIDHVLINLGQDIRIEVDYDKVVGLGERYSSANHKGHQVINRVEEVFCNQGSKTYFPLPFFLIDTGYGFFVDTKEVITFNFGETIVLHKGSAQGVLIIVKGDFKEMIKDFIGLTGSQLQAPKWVFGPWISAHRWNKQEMVNDVRTKLKKYQIPVTAMVLEQWSDEATFYIFKGAKYPKKDRLNYEDFDFSNSPWHDPKGMIDELHQDGIRLILWQCPVVKAVPEDEPFNHRHDRECRMVEEEEMVIKGAQGPYRIPYGNWFGGSMIPDFTKQATLDWWFGNRQYLLDIGVDGFKTDGGEFIYDYAENYIGETDRELKNNYSLEYVKAYGDFLGKDQVAFSRAGYIGQQSHTLLWAGDQKSTFAELVSVYNAGIHASICGQINWGFDIGGFSGELPSLELYIRASQLGVFTPIMQIHSEPVGGQFSVTDPTRVFNNERTPWNMAGGDESNLESITSLYRLRMNLLPYIYCEYVKAIHEKSTLMKHINVDYQGDFQEDIYVFGNLIVAPVLKEGCKERKIGLPQGQFYHILTHEKVSGVIEYNGVSRDDIFVYIPSGSALVMKKEEVIPRQIGNDLECVELEFKLFGPNGSYHYMDENNDFILEWKASQVKIEGKQNIKINYSQVY